jgi:hypothetical protein
LVIAVTAASSPGQAAQARIEAAEIILQLRRRIALGIDRDEQRADTVRVGAELAEQFRDFEQGGRADIRAMREAEETR